MQRLRELTTAVRRRLIVRAALSALGDATVVVGAVALVVALAAPWLPRWPAILIVAIISIVLLARARRALPTQSELVLFVDRKLEAGEAIVTAYELGSDPPELQRATIARAEAVLAGASAKQVRPAIDPRRIAILPFAALVFAAALVIPTPRVAIGARPDTVHVREAEALRRVERLVPEARDPEQRRRLEEAARHAEALRRELERGMERREAFDRLASLRDEVERARRQETPRERDARERASQELSGEPEMQRALDAQDDAALDRAVERAAARREAHDRERAREALERAAQAARAAGDTALEQSLLRRRDLLQRRAEQAALARELAEAMPELAGARMSRQLERLERDGDGSQLSRETVGAMRDAWSRLTPEERQRLADAMRRAQAAENAEARSQSQERQQGRPLSADELEAQLRQALENLDRLQMQLGAGGSGLAIPMQGSGNGSGDGNGNGNGSGSGNGSGNGNGNGNGSGSGSGSGNGSGSGGVGQGGGPGPRGGHTDPTGAQDGPLARVRPPLGAGAPSATTFEWVDPEGAPLPAGTPDPSGTATAAEGEPGAIERAPIPEDYREHVRTYFGGERAR